MKPLPPETAVGEIHLDGVEGWLDDDGRVVMEDGKGAVRRPKERYLSAVRA